MKIEHVPRGHWIANGPIGLWLSYSLGGAVKCDMLVRISKRLRGRYVKAYGFSEATQ